MAKTFTGIVRDLSGKGGYAVRARFVEGREVEEPDKGKMEPTVSEKTASS